MPRPSEEALGVLIADFEEEVRAKTRSRFVYLANHEVEFVDSINRRFWKAHAVLGREEREEWDRNFLIVFTFNTNSIEGSTLTLKETYKLLEENISPKKDYNDIVETKAAEKCLDFIRECECDFSAQFLLGLHEKYFRESKPFIAGKYKAKPNRVANSNFKTTPPELVRTDMGFFSRNSRKTAGKCTRLSLRHGFTGGLKKYTPSRTETGGLAGWQ